MRISSSRITNKCLEWSEADGATLRQCFDVIPLRKRENLDSEIAVIDFVYDNLPNYCGTVGYLCFNIRNSLVREEAGVQNPRQRFVIKSLLRTNFQEDDVSSLKKWLRRRFL